MILFKKWLLRYWFLIAAFSLMLIWAIKGDTTTTKHHENSIGIPMYQDNPNQYLMGYVSAGILAHENGRDFTVLEVRPTNTYAMFSQSIAFCGYLTQEQVDKISDRSVVVFTYSKVMHSRDCFDLFRVDKVGK